MLDTLSLRCLLDIYVGILSGLFEVAGGVGQVQVGKINLGVVGVWMEFKSTSYEEFIKRVSIDGK